MAGNRRWELFNCQRCGICCNGIELPYDPDNLPQLAEFLGITGQDVIEKYYGQLSADGRELIFDRDKREPCPFIAKEMDGGSICNIYPVRPEGCRLYPFDTMGGLDCPAARVVYEQLRQEQL